MTGEDGAAEWTVGDRGYSIHMTYFSACQLIYSLEKLAASTRYPRGID